MYRIKQLNEETRTWEVKAGYRNRNKAIARISRIRRAVITQNDNCIDGPLFLLIDPNGRILA